MEEFNYLLKTTSNQKGVHPSPSSCFKVVPSNRRHFELFMLICLSMISFQDVDVNDILLVEQGSVITYEAGIGSERMSFVSDKERAIAFYLIASDNSKNKDGALMRKTFKMIENSYLKKILPNTLKSTTNTALVSLFENGIVRHALTEQSTSNIPASIQIAMAIVNSDSGKLVYGNDIFGIGNRSFSSYKDAFRANSLKILSTGITPRLNANGNDLNEWVFAFSENENDCHLLKKTIEEYQLDLLDA